MLSVALSTVACCRLLSLLSLLRVLLLILLLVLILLLLVLLLVLLRVTIECHPEGIRVGTSVQVYHHDAPQATTICATAATSASAGTGTGSWGATQPMSMKRSGAGQPNRLT